MISISETKALPLQQGSILGAVLLIAGSCIGVGMLALPVLTSFAGFFPTLAIFCICWLFMTATALLLLEANLASGNNKANIISLSEKNLGKVGKGAAWVTFLFLFYSLIVAYITKGGDLIQAGIEKKWLIAMPAFSGTLIITLLSALFVYSGTWVLDRFNRLCMAGLFATYFYLMISGLEYSDASLLTRQNWNYSFFILPFIITSFGFHNMIPTLNEYLESDKKKLVISIILGGIIPFLVFILWILKVQTIIPFEGEISLSASYARQEISTEPLALWINEPGISVTAEFFAIFAIVTSLLGQSLSVLDFLADGLRIPKNPKGRALLCLLTFGPPFIFSQLFPHIFFKALELAGGIAAMILFGIIPALVVWIGRYRNGQITKPLLPGGRAALCFILLGSIGVVCFELFENLKNYF